jgi:hypothetical protein
MALFSQSLGDSDVHVQVATLKALTTFLGCLDEESDIMNYKSIMGKLIDIVIKVLQEDEAEGRASLESLIELTSSYAEIWSNDIKKLLFVCSEIMKTGTFELKTRSTALQIVATLGEANSKMLRDQAESLKDHIFPAIFVMLTQVEDEDDLQAWADKPEEEIHGRDDASSVASEALERLSEVLG